MGNAGIVHTFDDGEKHNCGEDWARVLVETFPKYVNLILSRGLFK